MENLTFQKYKLSQLLRIRKLSTAHYFSNIQDYHTPPHHHEAWEFVFCSRGQVETFQGKEQHTLHANQIILHMPKIDHRLQVGDSPTTLFVLSFVCTGEYLKILQNRVLRVNQSQRRLLSLIIQELGNAFELEDGQLLLGSFHPSENQVLGSEQMIAGYMENFLISMLRSTTNQKEHRWDSVTLDQALENRLATDIKEYIENHLSEHITLSDIANYVHYSRSHITTQFQSSTGMSISRYIAERRIERAKELLLAKELTVSQISETLGFSSLQYFSKCFKDAVGCSPSSYVKAPHL